VLFIHGSEDPLNLASGVRSYFEQVTYPDKELLIYQGSLHEPHNDLEHERVAADLISWIDRHLAAETWAGFTPGAGSLCRIYKDASRVGSYLRGEFDPGSLTPGRRRFDDATGGEIRNRFIGGHL
jgi:hypothetical protein